MPRSLPFLFLASGAVLLAGGCATRTLSIETEPAGAAIWLDQRALGVTPVTVEDRYGGVHEIVLIKDRHKPAVVYHDTFRFGLDLPPFDAVADLSGASDHQVVHVRLEPNPVLLAYETDPQGYLRALRERADVLRSRSRDQAEAVPPREPALPDPPTGRPRPR